MKRQLSFAVVVFLILATVLSVHAIYDQIATGTWGPAGNLSESRSAAAAVRRDDGRVLFIGGTGANGPISSGEALAAGAGFAAIAPMSEGRKGHTATKLSDGRVLVAGGNNGTGETVTAEVYDPSSDSWSGVDNLSTPRSGHTATLLKDGKVLIAGGENSSGPVDSLEIFDPAHNSFSSAGALHTPRSGHAAALLNDERVVIVGGTGVAQGNPVTLNSVEIYDATSGSVSNGPALASARSGHSATTLLDGNIFVMGGNDGGQDLASAEIYDAAANHWTTTSSSASTPRSGHAAFLLPNNANVLIVGGSSAGSDLSSAELFEPWSGQFKSTGSMTATHAGIAGAAVGSMDGFLAVAGGGSPASGEVYHFATVKTDKGDYAPGEYANVSGSGWQPGETVTLTFHENLATPFHPDEVVTAVADANGDISGVQYLLEEHDLNLRYFLTAVGAASQARTSFTDARNWDLAFAGTGTGSVLITASSGTVNAPVSCGGTGVAAASQTVTSTCAPNITFSDNTPTVTFTASAGVGSTFAGWSAGNNLASSTCTGTTNPCSATFTGGSPALTVTFNL